MSKGCSGSMKRREDLGQENLDAELGIQPIKKERTRFKKKVLKVEESSYMAKNEGRDAGSK